MMEPKAYSYIRFSNPNQEKGDSERRQVEEAELYAKEKGLSLDLYSNLFQGVNSFTALLIVAVAYKDLAFRA